MKITWAFPFGTIVFPEKVAGNDGYSVKVTRTRSFCTDIRVQNILNIIVLRDFQQFDYCASPLPMHYCSNWRQKRFCSVFSTTAIVFFRSRRRKTSGNCLGQEKLYEGKTPSDISFNSFFKRIKNGKMLIFWLLLTLLNEHFYMNMHLSQQLYFIMRHQNIVIRKIYHMVHCTWFMRCSANQFYFWKPEGLAFLMLLKILLVKSKISMIVKKYLPSIKNTELRK